MATPSIPEGHQSPSGLLEHLARPVEREDTENTHWLRGQRLTLQAPGRMRKWLLRAGLVVSGFGGALWYGVPLWHYYQTHVSTDNAAVVGAIIPISAHVSGLVVAVLVENGQHVTPGQTVVQLDPDTFAARMAQAEEAVTVATMRLQQAVAEVHFVEENSQAPTPSPQALPPSGAAGGAALAAGVVGCGSRAGGLPRPPVTGMRGGWGERGAGRRWRWGHGKSGFLFPIRPCVSIV